MKFLVLIIVLLMTCCASDTTDKRMLKNEDSIVVIGDSSRIYKTRRYNWNIDKLKKINWTKVDTYITIGNLNDTIIHTPLESQIYKRKIGHLIKDSFYPCQNTKWSLVIENDLYFLRHLGLKRFSDCCSHFLLKISSRKVTADFPKRFSRIVIQIDSFDSRKLNSEIEEFENLGLINPKLAERDSIKYYTAELDTNQVKKSHSFVVKIYDSLRSMENVKYVGFMGGAMPYESHEINEVKIVTHNIKR